MVSADLCNMFPMFLLSNKKIKILFIYFKQKIRASFLYFSSNGDIGSFLPKFFFDYVCKK